MRSNALDHAVCAYVYTKFPSPSQRGYPSALLRSTGEAFLIDDQ